jgi:CRISPR/Cas system-associated exonuclease Cas4 (RecB family)
MSSKESAPDSLATLSASALGDYLSCPRLFYFRRVERRPPAFRPVALALGSAFHEAVTYGLFCHGRGEAVAMQELRDRFRTSLHRELYRAEPPVLFDDTENEDQLVDLGVRMIEAFFRRVQLPQKVLGVEVAFSAELVDPETGEVLSVPLIGALDVVVEDKGRVVVWELKTARRRFAEDRLEFDLQPTAYRVGARSLGFPDVPVVLIATSKARLPDVQVERLVRGKQHERELVKTAASVLRAVAAGVDVPVRSWRCKSCAYAGDCR